MVDQGCTVLDVIVEHPIYGQLTGPLQLSNRYDVQRISPPAAHSPTPAPCPTCTEGIHLHTLSCPRRGGLPAGAGQPCGELGRLAGRDESMLKKSVDRDRGFCV